MQGNNAAAVPAPGSSMQRQVFFSYSGCRYLALASLIAGLAILLYVVDRPFGTRYGGTWAGYILGTAGALLIIWLTWYGYQKRNYADLDRRVAGLLSAHGYFGLGLLVIVTLHTGFHFGWNIHTLAYVLMCLAILSGLFGVFCYIRYPRLMTENRGGMTMQQMFGSIATLDEQLRISAMPLDEETAAMIERAVDASVISGSVWRQLTGRYPDCPTAAAIAHLDGGFNNALPGLEEAWTQARVLLHQKASFLTRVRRDIRYKAILGIWLYMHVPLSFMLLGALIAHVVSVFFFI